MRFIERIYIMFAKPFPDDFLKRIEQLSIYSNLNFHPEVYTGFSLFFSLLLSIMIALVFSLFYPGSLLIPIGAFLFSTLVTFFIFYFMLNYISRQRAKQIENVLPDALQLIGANVRAGLTPDKALFLSARPEFGVLTDEILFIGEETLAGKPVDEALLSFSKRVDSFALKRVVGLIVEGMNAGGELAALLEKTADDIRMSKVMQQEIQANIGAYVVFTMMAILIAAPVLYSVSINFVGFSVGIKESIGFSDFSDQAPIGGGLGFPTIATSGPSIDLDVLRLFSIVNLLISAVFGSILVGVLRYGEEAEGVQYIPGFILVSMVVFFVSLTIISVFLGNIIAF